MESSSGAPLARVWPKGFAPTPTAAAGAADLLGARQERAAWCSLSSIPWVMGNGAHFSLILRPARV